jgi:hypothetical protein
LCGGCMTKSISDFLWTGKGWRHDFLVQAVDLDFFGLFRF